MAENWNLHVKRLMAALRAAGGEATAADLQHQLGWGEARTEHAIFAACERGLIASAPADPWRIRAVG